MTFSGIKRKMFFKINKYLFKAVISFLESRRGRKTSGKFDLFLIGLLSCRHYILGVQQISCNGGCLRHRKSLKNPILLIPDGIALSYYRL